MNIDELDQLTSELEEFIRKEDEEDEKYFKLDSEILDKMLTQQVRLHLKWENILSSINNLYYESETYVDAAYSKAVNVILNKSNVDYSTTEAKILAQNDADYVKIKLIYNRLKVSKQKAESVLKALDTRKWILKNITDLVVHGSENHII